MHCFPLCLHNAGAHAGIMRMSLLMRATRRCASTAAAQPLRVDLPTWNKDKSLDPETIESVKESVVAGIKSGTGGSLHVVGGRSALAAVKGLALAETAIGGEKTSMWGDTSSISLQLTTGASDFHTFDIAYTADGFAFPSSAKAVDVLDKDLLPRDIFSWAMTTPSGYYNSRPLGLSFDKHSPEWQKLFTFSGKELVHQLVNHPDGEAVVRGMGPSLFNCLKVIQHAQTALKVTVPFGIRNIASDDALVSTFKDNIKDYFEEGMVHFRDEGKKGKLPSVRVDGKILTPPQVCTVCYSLLLLLARTAVVTQDFVDDDDFLVGFGLRVQ